jgi:SAM-dependent methyltransferase
MATAPVATTAMDPAVQGLDRHMPDLAPLLAGTLERTILHDGAVVTSASPLHVVTPPGQWWYALSSALAARRCMRDGAVNESLRFIFKLEVLRGRIGLGWTITGDSEFVSERIVSEGLSRVVLSIEAGTRLGRLILRNASTAGASEFRLREITVEDVPDGRVRYPLRLISREFAQEAVPFDGTSTFDTATALAINQARGAWLEAADLPLEGRVLDVGAGVGHFVGHYTRRGATVVAVDGRAENIEELRRRHPHVEAHVADVQTIDGALGSFDVVHCFGLLYHLDSPIGALRRLQAVCGRLLILETMVCDAAAPIVMLADETKGFSQALAGLGSRPSPSFVAMALNRVGFRCVYGASPVPRHEDFLFDWRNDLSMTRDGHPLRCVFVASHEPLTSPMLTPLVE